jgi:hypothetical protein
MSAEAPRKPQISVSTETTTVQLPYIVDVTGWVAEGKLGQVQLYVNPAELRAAAAFLESCADDGDRDGEVDRVMELPWEGDA